MRPAETQSPKNPYTKVDCTISRELFRAEGGYINVMKEMNNGTLHVHGRKWKLTAAKRWAESTDFSGNQ